MHSYLCLGAVTASIFCVSLGAQTALDMVSPAMARSSGHDDQSGISYTKLYINAIPADAGTLPLAFDLAQPTLTAQCTVLANGKYKFEMFVNAGGVTDTTYYRPWKQTDDDLFPPSTVKASLTMEFIGYTKVKPAKRQFEYVVAPPNQLRYNAPGARSPNMEEISFYLQYLRALPVLRITGLNRVLSFDTTALLKQLHSEPQCRAAGV